MKRYELKLDDKGLGVYKVSVVKDPAIDSTLVYFSAEKQEKVFFTDQEKRVIYSVVMRPNIDIFRRNVNGEPANVFYTPETVEKAQISYFRNNGNSKTNINHSEISDVEGVFPFESWIVSDAETDRAVRFGLDVKNGDWVMGVKVDNDEVWSDHIKTGKLDGFSVEANINYELKEDTKMSKEKKSFAAFLKESFNELIGKAENFESEIASVSKWWQNVTNTTFGLGEVIMRKGYNEDDEPTPIGAGDFELEDGTRLLTDNEGVIRFIFPKSEDAEETTEETTTENMATEETNEETTEQKAAKKAADATAEDADATEEKTEDTEEEMTEKEKALSAEIVELKAQIATLKAEKVKAETDLEKMARQTPASASIKDLPNPEAPKPYAQMSNKEKMKFNRENKHY